MENLQAKRLLARYRWLATQMGFYAQSQEIAQEAMLIKLSHNWKQSDKMTVIDAIRKLGHKTRNNNIKLNTVAATDFDENARELQGHFDDQATVSEKQRLFHEVLQRFTPLEREILVMRFSCGYTIGEIADIKQIPKQFAYRRVRTIIKKIRLIRINHLSNS